MACSILKNPGVEPLQSRTEIYRFQWIIQNYSFCFKSINTALNSPNFNVAGLNDRKLHLQLYPRQDEKFSEFVGLCLKENWPIAATSVKDKTDFKFDMKLSVIGSCGKLLKTREYCELEFKPPRTFPCPWGSSNFVKVKDIEKDANDSSEDTLTICCYLYRKNVDAPIPNGYLCRTTICVDRLTFKLNLILKSSNLLKREKLKFPNADFEIVFYEPLGMDGPCNLRIDIFYDKSKLKNCKGYVVDCKLTMLDGISVICSERAKHCFDHFPDTWFFPSGVFATEIQNFRRNYATEKKFDLFCEITCSSNKEYHFTRKTPVGCIRNDTDNHRTLGKDLQMSQNKFLNKPCGNLKLDVNDQIAGDKNCGNIKLEVNNQVVEHHKAVLFAGAPAFQAKFEQNNLEARAENGGTFDLDAGSIKLFLEHLFTDNVKKIEYEQAKVLVITAEKFCKRSIFLKETCLSFLKSKICEENACELLSLAHAVGDVQLKSTAMNFLVANSGRILCSPQWLVWMKDNMELASSVMSKISVNLCTLQTAGSASTSNSEHQQNKKRKIG